MVSLSYTVSADLQETLARIDYLRSQILTTPLAGKTELRLIWEAKFARLYGSLALAGVSVTRAQILKALTHPAPTTRTNHDIFAYKSALDTISGHWAASPKPVAFTTIETFTKIIAPPITLESTHRMLKDSEATIRQLLEYLQAKSAASDTTSGEHPIIQAAIAHVQLFAINFFPGDHGRIARIISNVFLAKYGYDVRGFLAMEKHWQQSPGVYELTIEAVTKHENLTPWLEYFAATIIASLEEVSRDIASARTHVELPAAFWELNDRQRTILTALEQPGATISNKKAQRLNDANQITTSRDLAKLTTLGLLYPHGKGRSVYYTRV